MRSKKIIQEIKRRVGVLYSRCGRWIESGAKRLSGQMPDVLELLGIVMLMRGLWMIYPPGAYIIAGLAMMLMGMVYGKKHGGKRGSTE